MPRSIAPTPAALLLLMAAPALAQEYQPYPEPNITPEQYAAYAEEVRQWHGATADYSTLSALDGK